MFSVSYRDTPWFRVSYCIVMLTDLYTHNNSLIGGAIFIEPNDDKCNAKWKVKTTNIDKMDLRSWRSDIPHRVIIHNPQVFDLAITKGEIVD